MIAKVESKNGNFQRWDYCLTACFSKDEETGEYLLICSYSNGKDATYPLSNESRVFIMNEQGKTIDRVYV